MKTTRSAYTFKPLTPDRWQDFETLFGERGACGGCWCMLWRLKRSQFEQQKGKANRNAMHRLVKNGEIPGILAYHRKQAIAWCAIAPREAYPSLSRSRILKPVDDQPVWSISCLFVEKQHRRQGVSIALLKAAKQHVKKQGGRILEGYPVEPKKNPVPPVFAWTGIAAAFKKAGFKECLRRSETRPIMRAVIK